jgi:mono/diheme cytochrome c family protein
MSTTQTPVAVIPTRRRRRWPRRVAIGVAALLALGAVAATTAITLGQRKMQRQVDLPAFETTKVDAGAASLDRGRYLYASRGCADCHGGDGAGRRVIGSPDGDGFYVKAPDISQGSPTARYDDTDWTRLLRHGVKADGRAAMIMPSEDYARMTDADFGAIVTYVRSLPPAGGTAYEARWPVPVVAAYGLGAVKDASEKIDHHAKPSQPVARVVSVEHGAYVAQMCIGCHGAKLEGGRIPGGPPEWPAAARLAPGEGSVMPRYASGDAFVAMLKSGQRPDGTPIAVMPFESLGQLDDVDARALHLYLSAGEGRAGVASSGERATVAR